MRRILQTVFNFFYIKYISTKYNVKVARGVYVNRNSIFEGSHSLGSHSLLFDSKLGYGSYVSENSILKKCNVGRFCSIGPNVKCVFGKHPTKKFVSTHPSFFSTLKQAGFTFTDRQKFVEYSKPKDKQDSYSIVIGNDVWIGAEVTIMEGVTIGDGAILAAKSLVTTDVPPFTIVGGVPAKKLKMRFPSEDISFLMNFKWWDKDIEWIDKNFELFDDIEKFKTKVSQ